MFKPPKMFHLRSNADVPPPPAQSAPEQDNQRVWSPTIATTPSEETIPLEIQAPQMTPPSLSPAQPENSPEEIEFQETNSTEKTETLSEPIEEEEPIDTIPSEIMSEDKPDTIETTENLIYKTISQTSETAENPVHKEDDFSRYARPKASYTNEPVMENDFLNTPQSFSEPDELDMDSIPFADTAEETEEAEDIETTPSAETPNPINGINQILENHKKVVRAPSLNSIPFADIWYTAEKIAYIRDKETPFALIPFETDDMEDFYKALEQGYTGQSSYAIRFAGESYRVERIITLAGVQYNCRKMPSTVPDIYSLGLPKHTVDYLLTLGKESGLLLFGGPTGMGKTTSASALMKKFLEIEGGFMYTIEDPPEMPLEGLYRAQNGGLGLCKQCPVDNERWGDGIKSALRSRPRYILVGEIRTPETASQVLRAATSGHLVLSTIHASTVEDALESLIKYASGAGLTESLAADLLARGILGVIHQKLEGSTILRPVLTSAFASPRLSGGDQMRSLIRNNTINLQTLIEAQSSRLMQGRPLFGSEKLD